MSKKRKFIIGALCFLIIVIAVLFLNYSGWLDNKKPWSDILSTAGYITAFFGIITITIKYFIEPVSDLVEEYKTQGLILAAGNSKRWQASFTKIEEDYYKTLYWEEINNCLDESGHKYRLDKPPDDLNQHKALARIDARELIWHAFLNYKECGIENITVVTGTEDKNSRAQKEIISYIKDMNDISKSKWIQQEDVPGADETATSTWWGLKNIKGRGNTIVSYSDIYLYNKGLLKKLKYEHNGDIIIVVDTNWTKNYPTERIWHDKSHAELVLGKDDKIEKIGEIRNRYEKIPKSFESKFDQTLSDCIGEIVGLFKFSFRARRVFCNEFEKFTRDQEFKITEWSSVNDYTPKKNIARKEALLGCFLEYLALHSEIKLSVKMLKVQGGWAEIDHWGDLYNAQKMNVNS